MRTQVHGSHIQNFLEDEVRYLLAPAADELNDLDFEKTYIPNPLMEEKFEKCLTYSPYNKTIVLLQQLCSVCECGSGHITDT